MNIKVMTKRVFAALLSLVMVVSLCLPANSSQAMAAETKAASTITSYTAFGDSVATGYGPLEADYQFPTYYFKTGEGAYPDLIKDSLGISDENYHSVTAVQLMIADVYYLLGGNFTTEQQARFEEKNLGYHDDEYEEIMKNYRNNKTVIQYVANSDLITIAVGNMDIMVEPINKSKDEAGQIDQTKLMAKVQEGLEEYATYLPLVLGMIHQINPNAKVLVFSQYDSHKKLIATEAQGQAVKAQVNAVNAKANEIVASILVQHPEFGTYVDISGLSEYIDDYETQVNSYADYMKLMSPSSHENHPGAVGHQWLRDKVLDTLGISKPEKLTKTDANTSYLAFSSDVHTTDNEYSLKRLEQWVTGVSAVLGNVTFDYMGFTGDLASASYSGLSSSGGRPYTPVYWNKVARLMDTIEQSPYVAQGIYTTGNHDFDSPGYYRYLTNDNNKGRADKVPYKNIQKSGEAANTDMYQIYCFGANSSSQKFYTDDITALDNYLKTADSSKPVFVMSHYPLHSISSRTSENASSVISVLNKYPNVIFLWGHNHTESDSHYNKVYTGSLDGTAINFTYASAGCMSDSDYSTGSGNTTSKGLVAKMNGSDNVVLTYYDKNANVVSTATVSITGESSEPSGNYTDEYKFVKASTLENGKQYVIVADGLAMNTNVNSGYTNNDNYSYQGLAGNNVTVSGSELTAGVQEDNVFQVEVSNSKYLLKNVKEGKYLNATYTQGANVYLDATGMEWSYSSNDLTCEITKTRHMTFETAANYGATSYTGTMDLFTLRSSKKQDIEFYEMVSGTTTPVVTADPLYTKVSAPEAGKIYVIAATDTNDGNTYALGTTADDGYITVNSGSKYQYSGLKGDSVTALDNGLGTKLSGSNYWTVEKTSDGYALKNVETGKYLVSSYTKPSGYAGVGTIGLSDTAETWTYAASTGTLTGKGSSKILQYQTDGDIDGTKQSGGADFFSVRSSLKEAVYFYELSDNILNEVEAAAAGASSGVTITGSEVKAESSTQEAFKAVASSELSSLVSGDEIVIAFDNYYLSTEDNAGYKIDNGKIYEYSGREAVESAVNASSASVLTELEEGTAVWTLNKSSSSVSYWYITKEIDGTTYYLASSYGTDTEHTGGYGQLYLTTTRDTAGRWVFASDSSKNITMKNNGSGKYLTYNNGSNVDSSGSVLSPADVSTVSLFTIRGSASRALYLFKKTETEVTQPLNLNGNYAIVNAGNYALSTETGVGYNDGTSNYRYDGLKPTAVTVSGGKITSGATAANSFKITTNADGTYYIQSADGRYLNGVYTQVKNGAENAGIRVYLSDNAFAWTITDAYAIGFTDSTPKDRYLSRQTNSGATEVFTLRSSGNEDNFTFYELTETVNTTEYYFYMTEGKGSVSVRKQVLGQGQSADSVTATAAAGYTFDGWYNEAGVKVSSSASFKASAAGTYTAKFKADPVTVKYAAKTGGKVSVSSEAVSADEPAAGSTATANSGYKFLYWTSDSEGLNKVSTQEAFVPQMENGAYKAVTYYAWFEKGCSGGGDHVYAYVSNGNGTHSKKCTKCNEVSGAPVTCDQVITVHGYAATCAKDGLTDGAKCYICGGVSKAQETISKSTVSHSYSVESVYMAATCTSVGVNVKACAVCGDTQKSYVAKLDHTYEEHAAKEATETEDGNQLYYTCSTCSNVFDADKNVTTLEAVTIKAAGHTHNMTKTEAVAATCIAAGNIEYWTCSGCKKTFRDEAGTTEVTDVTLAKDSSNHVGGTEIVGAVEATCTSSGYTGATVCKGCGNTLENGEEIPAFGHSFAEPEVTEEGTCIKETQYIVRCTLCDYYYRSFGNRNPSNHADVTEIRGAVEATCTNSGFTGTTVWKCCEEVESYGAYIEPLGHKFTNYPAVAATEDKGGNVEYNICNVCGKYYEADGTTETTAEAVKTNPLAHTHNLVKKEAVEATCTTAGTEAYWTCSKCNKRYSDEAGTKEISAPAEIAALGHSYDSGAVTKQATCTEEGVKTYTCAVCKDTKTESIAKVAHKLTKHAAVAATEETDGNVEYNTCDVCHKYFEADGKTETSAEAVVIKATGHTHNLVKTEAVAATCTTAGTEAYWTCTKCSKLYSDAAATKEISAPVVIDRDPSKHSGETEVRGAIAATCTTAGYTGNTVCKACGALLEDGEIIQALGHSYDAGKVTKEATCSETGIKTFTCSRCNYTYTETIARDASKHVGGTEVKNAKDATCTETGYTGDTVCKGCGVILTAGEDKAALGHSYNAGVVTVEATCALEGIKTYTCTVCKETKTDPIAKNPENHTGVTEVQNGKAATCTEAGYTGDTVCKGCGETLVTGKAIAPKGHTWDDGKVTSAATCATEGVKTYTCTVCNATKTETLAKDPSNHEGSTEVRDAAAASCTADGYTGDTYCLGCGVKTATGKAIAATGHKYDNGVVTKAATCAAEGVKTFTCTVCKETKTEAIAMIAHKLTKHAAVAATEEAGGNVEHYTCDNCGKYFEADGETETTATAVKTNPLAHTHKLVKTEATVATCVATGNVEYWACSKCGKKYIDAAAQNEIANVTLDIEPDNHVGGTEVKNAKAATCTATGYTGDTYCKSCGVKTLTGKTIAATGHKYNNGVVTKTATCSAEGVKTFTCSVCKETKTEVIAKNSANHTGGTEVRGALDATCTSAGYTGDTYCLGCESKLTTGSAIAALGHKFDNGTVTKNASCTAEGIKTYTCSVCKATKTEAIAKVAHVYVYHAAVAATEDKGGNVAYYTCENCDKYFDASKKETTASAVKTNPLAHTHVLEVIDAQPGNCVTNGTAEYFICEKCNKMYRDQLATQEITSAPVTGKNPEVHTGNTELKNVKAASCTEDGYTGDVYCKDCQKKTSTGIEIKAAGHKFDAGIVTKEASCTEKGEKTFTCSVCKATKVEAISAKGHSMVHYGAVAATETHEGNVNYYFCEICGKYYKDAEATMETTEAAVKIPALNHVHKLVKVEGKNATCTEAGYKAYYSCDKCGKLYSDANGANEIEGPVAISATGHSMSRGVVTKMPTCTETGEKTYTCSKCGKTETSVINALGHDFTGTSVKPATTTASGYTQVYCNNCSAVYSKTSIAKIKGMKLSYSTCVYSGSYKKPSVLVTDVNGKVIAASNYKVTYSSNKYVGTATVKVVFDGRQYKGTLTKTFKINPVKTSITSLTALSKGFTVKWKKVTKQITGYELQYSTYKSFSKKTTVRVTSYKTTSKKITKLSSKKKYYVRVRVYKTVKSKKYYSGWTPVKTVTTK